jgi:hypothetical protein
MVRLDLYVIISASERYISSTPKFVWIEKYCLLGGNAVQSGRSPPAFPKSALRPSLRLIFCFGLLFHSEDGGGKFGRLSSNARFYFQEM